MLNSSSWRPLEWTNAQTNGRTNERSNGPINHQPPTRVTPLGRRHTDNFLTGRRFGGIFGPETDGRSILLERSLEGEQPSANDQPAGRTALLAALCVGAPSVAELLISRQHAFVAKPCDVKDSRSHAYEHAVIKLTASRGRRASLCAGFVWVARYPDVCCVNDPCGPGGLTALRLAAALGLGDVVSLLLKCPSCLVGAHSGTRNRPTPLLGEMARALPLGRTVFHDIARADVVRRTAEPGRRAEMMTQLDRYVDIAFDATDLDDKQYIKLVAHRQLQLARVIVKLHGQIVRRRRKQAKTPPLDNKERARLEETFCFLDKDGSGSITTKELGAVMRDLNHGQPLSEVEIANMVREVDADGDHTINRDEFYDLVTKEMSEGHKVSEVIKMFEKLERDSADRREFISTKDLKDIMLHIDETVHHHEIEELFLVEAGDKDTNEITYEKLLARTMRNPPSGESNGEGLPTASSFKWTRGGETEVTLPITMQESPIKLTSMARTILVCDERGRLAIHYAAARGNRQLLDFLIKQHTAAEADQVNGALWGCLNQCDKLGWTPLALAVMHGHLKCAKLLLDAGSCPLQHSSLKSRVNVPCALGIGLMHLKQLYDEDELATRQEESTEESTVDDDQRLNGTSVDSAEQQAKHAQREVLTTAEKKAKREKRRTMTRELLGAMFQIKNAYRARSKQIVLDQSWSLSMYLVWLCLLTFVALWTTSGFISSGRFLLKGQQGDLVPGNDFPETYGGLDTFEAHVQDVASLNEWMQDVLLGTLFPDDTGLVNTHNVLIGALRLRQQRQQVKAGGCEEEKDRPIVGPLGSDAVCFEGDKWFKDTLNYDDTKLYTEPLALGVLDGNATNQDVFVSHFVTDGVNNAEVYQPWFGHGATTSTSQKRAFWGERYTTAGHIIDISPGNASRAAATMRLIIDGEWIDDAATRVVFADWTTYNWRLKELVVSHLVVELPKTGGASPAADVVVMPTVPSELFDTAERLHFTGRPPWIVFGETPRLDAVQWAEATLMILNFFYFLGELAEMTDPAAYFEKIVENAFDVICDLLTSVWCAFRVMWYAWALSLKVSPDAANGDATYRGEFQSLAHLFTTARALICISIIVAWLKLTKYARLLPNFGPRLSAALSTIVQPEVVIFTMLFVAVAAIFGLACTVAFGTTVDGFSSLFPSSFLTIFVLFFGDWDYEELQSAAEPAWLGSSLFFVMVIFGFAIMGNIFIAVISNAYDQIEKTSVDDWEDEVNRRLAERLWKRLLRRGGTTGRTHGGGTKQASRVQVVSKQLFGGNIKTDESEDDILEHSAAVFLDKRYNLKMAKRNDDSYATQLKNLCWAQCTDDATLCTVTHREGDESATWLQALASPSSQVEEDGERKMVEEAEATEAEPEGKKQQARESSVYQRREQQRQQKRARALKLYSLVRWSTPEAVGANFDCEHLFYFDWRELPAFDSAVLEDELKDEAQRQREHVNIQLEYLRTQSENHHRFLARLVQQQSGQ